MNALRSPTVAKAYRTGLVFVSGFSPHRMKTSNTGALSLVQSQTSQACVSYNAWPHAGQRSSWMALMLASSTSLSRRLYQSWLTGESTAHLNALERVAYPVLAAEVPWKKRLIH